MSSSLSLLASVSYFSQCVLDISYLTLISKYSSRLLILPRVLVLHNLLQPLPVLKLLKVHHDLAQGTVGLPVPHILLRLDDQFGQLG